MANKKSTPKKIKKRYTFQPTLSILLLLCFTLLFLLGWAFTLGILVGKSLLPMPFSALSSNKGTAAEEQEGMTTDHFEPIKEEDFVFYDQLVHKKETTKKEIPDEPPVRKHEPKSRETPPTQGIGDDSRHFSIQVAAFKDKTKTEEMVERLNMSGYRAHYRAALINGETFYRVRCGPFSSEKEAKEYANRLTLREGIKPFIIYPNNN